MDSKLGLIIQLNGVFLITILSLLLRRSLKLTALKYWAVAWLCLSFALISLRLAFSYEALGPMLFTYYFLGEYIFGFMLIAGCRSLDGESELQPGFELRMIPFILIAIVLPFTAADFNDVFNIHSLILSGFYLAAFFALRKSELRTFGWRVMHAALAILAIDFFLYSVIFSARYLVDFDYGFLSYNSIVDLVVQTTLGFGMVMVLLEKVLSDSQTTNERLRDAHRRLEELVHTDPLTAAFNRHAFYGFVKKRGEDNAITSGCVGFFDIDDLKGLNDRYGHAVGDAAIRVVVRAIREVIRAEDLIYRWGGDEFFVIMVSMDARMAQTRMSRLEGLLTHVRLEELAEPIDIGVSCGFTDFADTSDLEKAINEADAAMYRRKQERKKKLTEKFNHIPQMNEHAPRELTPGV